MNAYLAALNTAATLIGYGAIITIVAVFVYYILIKRLNS